ncbi:recombinase family protein [Bradyrhizobium tunisiense]|uniref:recombinase family protein n=1 Tax=Bradyrhizobium tunisiense TaxID=3278709 RepID=UPI0035E11E67
MDRGYAAAKTDVLAQSTRDLLNLLGTIAEKGAGLKSLRDILADTTTPHGRLMLTVVGGGRGSNGYYEVVYSDDLVRVSDNCVSKDPCDGGINERASPYRKLAVDA